MRRLRTALVLLGLAAAAPAWGAPAVSFSAEEIERILQHGPWPPEARRDPSNRASGHPHAIELGRRLFMDRRLGAEGRIACASCHQPERGWADGLARGVGLAEGDRNTPGVANAHLNRWFGWDGGQDSLWAQSIRPILDPREMGGSARQVATLLGSNRDLGCLYRKAFGAPPTGPAHTALVNAGKALAAFQETLTSARSPFDEFRDALARGEGAALSAYPVQAQRGLRIFVGKGNCAVCHFGPAFSNGEFADVGIPYFIAPGKVDAGRYEGIRRLKASAYNLLGPHSDDPKRSTAAGTQHVRLDQRNWGEFRVPGLRDVARTAPYMHSGRLASLAEVVRHYSELNEDRLHVDGERILRPLRLSAEESADLVAFLESLSGRTPVQPPPPARVPADCRP